MDIGASPHAPAVSLKGTSTLSTLSRKTATIAAAVTLTAGGFSGAAYATPVSHARPAAPAPAEVHPMTSSKTVLHLPDGKRTAHVWKTWYRKSNGKYHGHYGWTSASKRVSVYVVLWTSDKTKYLPTKGHSYAYSNQSRVQLFACDNDYPNGEDCSATW